MRKLLYIVTAIACIACPFDAYSKQCASLKVSGSAELVNDTDLTSAASFTIPDNDNVNWDEAAVQVEFVDANASITKLQMTCTGGRRGSATQYNVTSGDVSAGVLASAIAKWDHGDGILGGGTLNWIWRVNVSMLRGWTCTFTVDSGTADVGTDTLKVYAEACSLD